MNLRAFDQPEGKSLNIMHTSSVNFLKTLHKSGLRKVNMQLVFYSAEDSRTSLLCSNHFWTGDCFSMYLSMAICTRGEMWRVP